MNIQIFGEWELRDHIKKGHPVYSHCISIRNSTKESNRQPFPLADEIQNGFVDILHLEFHDLEKKEHLPKEFKGTRIPALRDVKRAYRFYKKAIKSPHFTGFTVHCWRGVSRSSAIALGLAYLMTRDEKQAADLITQVRKEAAPLPRIVRFWDKVLKTNLIHQSDIIREKRNEELKKWFFNEIDNGDALLEELEVVND